MSLKRNTGKANKDVADRAQKVLLIEKLKSLGYENVMGIPLRAPEKYTIADLKTYVKNREEALEEAELRRQIRRLGINVDNRIGAGDYSLRDLRKIYKDVTDKERREGAKMLERQRKQAEEEAEQFAAETAYLQSFNFMFPRSRRSSLKFRCN